MIFPKVKRGRKLIPCRWLWTDSPTVKAQTRWRGTCLSRPHIVPISDSRLTLIDFKSRWLFFSDYTFLYAYIGKINIFHLYSQWPGKNRWNKCDPAINLFFQRWVVGEWLRQQLLLWGNRNFVFLKKNIIFSHCLMIVSCYYFILHTTSFDYIPTPFWFLSSS